MLKEYPNCLVCDETPNPKGVNALIPKATMYDSTPFDSKDPVIVSETEVYCCTKGCTRGVVTQEDALDALWNQLRFIAKV
jgi:hypothetical protein